LKAVSIDGETLNLEDIELVAVDNATVALAHGCLEKIKQSRQTVEAAIQKEVIAYGINTGFGKFKDQIISPENIEKLQENLVVSHACGTGPLFDQSTVRAMVLLRANALAKGFSGIRPELIELLIALLNNQIHPLVPEQGSVGASGDLSPLSHIALSLIGQGQCHFQGKTVDSLKALEACGLKPAKLMAKEGLALTNGTQTMSAVLSLTLLEAERLAKIADIVAAMSIEALMGSKKPFLPSVQTVRPHPGQQACAHNLLRLLKDSTIMDAHIDCDQVQDSYSLRCIPQVHGASRQAFKHVREVVSIEINSATDNPLIFSDDETDNQIV
jgi:histidine ammonia-lyase